MTEKELRSLCDAIEAHNKRLRTKKQHAGPLTRLNLDIVRWMIWGYNGKPFAKIEEDYLKISRTCHCSLSSVKATVHKLRKLGILVDGQFIAPSLDGGA